MQSGKAVIIGYDAVSPLGIDLAEQWRRAVRGESGIGPLTRFPLTDDFPVRIAGQAPDIDHLAYPFIKPREQAVWRSPIFKYALLTAQRALEKSGVILTPDIAPRVAITYSSAIGGLDAVLQADRQMRSAGKWPHPYANPNACINMVGGKISMLTGATGPIVATIAACATGVASLIIGAMLLEQGMADVAICGAADFALVEPIVAGFATMNGAYTPKEGYPLEPAEKASRPFSINRRGFVISEGAGAMIIATPDFARTHGLAGHIEIAGWGMTSDAHHFVSPHFETVRECMRQCIAHSGIAPGDIQAINAHATSTRIGDKVEVDALRSIFGGRIPPVTANKSILGHAMGAASAIESIFAIMGMATDTLPPTINYEPDPELAVDCVAEGSRRLSQEHVMKSAFGFGGSNACIVFRRTG